MIRHSVFALLGAAALSVAFAQPEVSAQTRRATATQTYSREEATVIAKRIHMALFNQDDAGSVNDTVNEIQAGRLRPRLDALVAVPEFRSRFQTMPVDQQVNQIFQAMLNRAPTASQLRTGLTMARSRQYAELVTSVTTSPEFQEMVRNTAGSGSGGGGTASVDSTRAVSCQEQVVEKVRNDLPGIVLLRFENAEADGNAVKGVAWDMVDDNRRMTYRCDGGASYSYDDGRRDRSAPNEGDFPSERVRACVNDVRNRVQAQRQGDITFESAGLMPTGSGDQVRGLGFEKKQGGQNFHYQCQMDGTRVVSATFNWR
jgi:hypothetical protein